MIGLCIQHIFAASPVIRTCLTCLRISFLVNSSKFKLLKNVYRIQYVQKMNSLPFGLLAGCCFSKQSEDAETDPIASGGVKYHEAKRLSYHDDRCEGLLNEAISSSLSSNIHSGNARSVNLCKDERNRLYDQHEKLLTDEGAPTNVESSPDVESIKSNNESTCVLNNVNASVPLKRLSSETINECKSKYQKLDNEGAKKELDKSSVDKIVVSETSYSVSSDITKIVSEVEVQKPENEVHDTGKDEAASTKKSKKKPKQRPNYFISMKISNPVIHKSLEVVQTHIVEQNSQLKPAVVPLKKLHITLMVLCLNTEEEHEKALHVLKSFHETLNADICKCPLKLEFRGLDTFNGKVLFAKVKEGDALNRLNNIVDDVIKHFKEASIPSSDKKEFNPHLTVMKLSRAPKLFRQGIKKIHPSLYSSYKDNIFGTELIKSIELLSMVGTENTSGYYKGHQLFLGDANESDVPTPSALLAEELQDKKEEISRLAEQQLEKLIKSSDKPVSADLNSSLDVEATNSEK